LKENFDRFNFALYKEKQMADFRRWLTVLAVIAVMAFAASAQVGVGTGSSAGLLTCVATAAGTPEMRPEGFTELAGDIVISCTGGPTYQIGASIPTTNVVVYMQPTVPITSRFISSNGASEALLIIDEAGSSLQTGVAGAYGPKAPQVLCTTAQQQTAGGSACAVVVGTDAGTAGGPYEVSVPAPGSSFVGVGAPNVYQGKVGDFGSQSVTFYNVPVLPPATNGVTRTFRITNIRVPVAGTTLNYTLGAFISTSPNQTLPLVSTVINIGVVGPAMTAAVVPLKSAFQQCVATSVGLTANLVFTEGFATGFKTRVVPGGASNGIPGNATGNMTWAAEAQNLVAPSNQNIPGGLYGGFAANTESGFIFPPLSTSNTGSGAVNYTAGLADYGSRLKAIFTNIPAGLTLYVSTTSASNGSGFVPGGTSLSPYAVLVATNSGEATPDGSSFAPITGTSTGSDGLNAIALSANSSGAAIAVWEVTNANPSAKDTLKFSVYISYSATSSSTTNPYGLPITDLPLGAPVNNVSLSYAPEPGGGTFSTANATQGQTPTPRFNIANIYQGRYVTINLCQTTLLYPYVVGISGYDTGIAVANTSMDPFGTVTQTGSCKLYGYGVTYSTTGATPATTAAMPVIPGCDSIANPLPGTNCMGGPITASNTNGYFIAPGTVGVVMASQVLPNFQGYVIAVCNFYYAHGYAALTDVGLRNLWSSYLALELSPVGIGSPRSGVSGIETLAH
jgi:hypothetical protein